MRTWLKTILLLTLAIALAIFIKNNDNRIILELTTVEIEMRLSFFVLALIVLLMLLYALLRLFEWTITIPMRVSLWRKKKNLINQQVKLENAWLSLIDGRVEMAQQDLRLIARRSKDNVQRQMVALLTGIRAEHAQDGADKVAAMLVEARNLCVNHPKFLPYVAIVEAEVLLDQADADKAYAILAPHYPLESKFPQIARLRLRIARLQAKPEDVLFSVRQVAKRGLLPAETLKENVVFALVRLLNQSANEENLQKVWKGTRSEERLYPEVVLAAAEAFSRFNRFKEAKDILELAIEKMPEPPAALFAAYARGPEALVHAKIAKAEAWLKRWSQNSALLQALGILCIQANIWGAAQKYLEQSLHLSDQADTRILLANLFDGLGREEHALQFWRSATQKVLNHPQISVGVPLVRSRYDISSPEEPDRSVGL